jgi:hypothetical protein
MAAKMALPQGASVTQNIKRKFSAERADSAHPEKRARVSQVDQASNKSTGQPAPPSFPPILQDNLLASVRSKFEVKILSVLSSTSMQLRVESILNHLGRFHPWDLSVLPGVVLLYAKAANVNKLISILETSKRRIGEANQKWYQYNRLAQEEVEIPFNSAPEPSIVEDTVLPVRQDEGLESGGEEEAFETMPAVFERALRPHETKNEVSFSLFLSRVPVPELARHHEMTLQTNEAKINSLRG